WHPLNADVVVMNSTWPKLMLGLCLLVYTSARRRFMSNIIILFVNFVLFSVEQVAPWMKGLRPVNKLNERHWR
ncbi:hypothetical protein, partial [Escherichia coli]|uniref:hypothetical protein n=1 Tax=Escherichia coli TaxID=562 RepID=UPI0022832CDD